MIGPFLSENADYYGDVIAAKSFLDRREVVVLLLGWGWAQLSVGPGPRPQYYEDSWYFETRADAIRAFAAWNGEGEPTGWFRHPASGRRRPGGDASKEYILPYEG